ncbi:MAG: ATP-binding protein [Pseudomonadota bacterium]
MRRDGVGTQGRVFGWVVGLAAMCASALAAPTAARVEVSSGLALDPAPEPRFVRFGAEQGLPALLNDMVVDRRGDLWLATSDGLARYDGDGFRFWRRTIGSDASLQQNDVMALALDVDDRLWVLNSGGLVVLDRARRGIAQIVFDGEHAVCGREIAAMAADPEGGVRIGTYDGAVCAIGRDGRIRRLLPADGGAGLGASAVVLRSLPDGRWLIATDAGLWRLHGTRLEPVAPERLGDAYVFAITDDIDGGLWIGTDRGLFAMAQDGTIRPAPWRLPELANNAVVRRDPQGGYWIGTAAGLFRAVSRDAPALPVHGRRHADGLSSGVFGMLIDREGGLWAASYSQGLSYLPPGHARFASIDEIDGVPLERIDPAAAIGDGAGGFWIVGSRRLYALPAGASRPQAVVDASALGVEWLLAATRCADGRLWLASFDRAFGFDPRSKRVGPTIRYPDDGSHTPHSLWCDSAGRLWVSLYGGALRVHDRDGRTHRALAAEAVLGGPVADFARLDAGPDGVPWTRDVQGLRRWDGRRFVPVALPGGERVDAFAFVAPRTLWVARYGSLERYEWRDGRARLRERIDGEALPPVQVAGMLASAGQLWMTTPRGLLRFEPASGRVRMFGVRDGLPDIDFALGPPVQNAVGPALALSKRGIVLFDPGLSLPPPRAPALSVEAIDLRRGEDTIAFEDDGAAVTMRPGDRDLRVAVRVRSLADPAAHRYRFRLRGYDPDWVRQGERGERGERVFSSLPPGRYALEFQGADADGVWSSTYRIPILVEAPWWRRWWALLLYATLASALVWWLAYLDRVRLRRNHNYQLIKQKRELAEQASLAKSRFLANLGHEIRTPMTGVLGMSELLLSTPLDARQQDRIHAIRRAGEHLLRLVNDALDLARIEAGRFELDEADFALDAIVEDVVGLMRPLAERKGLRFVATVDADVRGGWRGDPTRVRQILLNLLGNAIKFTERGEVSLAIASLAPRGLRCVVCDTGPGLDAEQQRRLFRRFEQAEGARTASRYGGSGLGLAICQELAVAMGGGIELSSAPGEGACFTVRLPLAPSAAPIELPPAPYREAAARDVLLVEDDPIVADALTGLLQTQGHRVVHAGHALAAMTARATRTFDLAFVDLDLPGMDGLSLARQLRAQGFDRPLIAITARADAEAEPQAMDAGFDAFLRKPLTGTLLAEAMLLGAGETAR